LEARIFSKSDALAQDVAAGAVLVVVVATVDNGALDVACVVVVDADPISSAVNTSGAVEGEISVVEETVVSGAVDAAEPPADELAVDVVGDVVKATS
jgi:hypothetical protein